MEEPFSVILRPQAKLYSFEDKEALPILKKSDKGFLIKDKDIESFKATFGGKEDLHDVKGFEWIPDKCGH
jgi:hypothetical protein